MKARGGAALWLAAGLVAGLAACVAVLLSAPPSAQAQIGSAEMQEALGSGKKVSRSSRSAARSTLPPAFQVAVGPLGFSAPGAFYLGQRLSMVSLDFLDENRLLFTFRAPGLIHREAGSDDTGSGTASEERQIRAVVLELPSGRVEAEALWTLHDRLRYLWMLNDGSFLLRDGEDLKKGDATLELKPYLRFPGPLLWLDTDPSKQFLVTDSQESVAVKPDESGASRTSVGAAANGANTTGQAPQSGQNDLVVRILRRETGQVMLVSRSRTVVHLPINSDGYLESLRSRGIEWQLNLHSYSGGSTLVGRLDSTCAPTYEFVSQRELVATVCSAQGGHRLVAMTSDGERLWEAQLPETDLWPRLILSPDGSRLARETLIVSAEISASAPLSPEDIKGQLVEIFDAVSGKIALTVPVTPALDGGGNMAISPSGRRVAVLNAGFIQIFELPAPLSPPESRGNQPPH